jgi:hypothetical protein
LARENSDRNHFFALYRIEPSGPMDTVFVDSLRAACADSTCTTSRHDVRGSAAAG